MAKTIPTAVEILKAFGYERGFLDISTQALIAGWALDKGFRIQDMKEWNSTGYFTQAFINYVLRSGDTGNDGPVTNFLVKNMAPGTELPETYNLAEYRGSRQQNLQIDSAFLSRDRVTNGFHGVDAGDFFQVQRAITRQLKIQATRICIVGAGPTGVMVAHALSSLGFSSITMYDKTGRVAGIWNQENVKRSRNNPRRLSFDGLNLDKAPGSGEEVLQFTHNMHVLPVSKAAVETITPGHLHHLVKLSHKLEPEAFPIVINCCGLGKPKPLSDPSRMTTNVSKTDAGFRWQQNLPADVDSKSIVMIGLGNSTAEMLVQIQKLRDEGRDIQYKILTHYPEDAIQRPFETVPGIEKTPGGTGVQQFKNYRVWRDLTKPDLTSYAGDLPELRRAYMVALREQRIISDVHKWTITGGGEAPRYVGVTRGNNKAPSVQIRATDIYTLIGYQMEPEAYKSYGIETGVDGYPLVDYDGEFQRRYVDNEYGAQRVFAGYYGLGPAIETEDNRNAVVIPGNIFRMGDLVMGVIFRAMQARGK